MDTETINFIEIPLFSMKENDLIEDYFESYEKVIFMQVYGRDVVLRDC